LIALAILAGGSLLDRSLRKPRLVSYAREGISFKRPGGWLPALEPDAKVSPLAQRTAGFGVVPTSEVAATNNVHTIFAAPQDARLRVEVRIEDRPAYPNLPGALSVQRLGHYGEYYWSRSSGNASIASRDWLRTEFRYAWKPSKSGSPQIAEAVEYAIVNEERLFIVTLHASPEGLPSLDALIAQSLRISSPQNSSNTDHEATP